MVVKIGGLFAVVAVTTAVTPASAGVRIVYWPTPDWGGGVGVNLTSTFGAPVETTSLTASLPGAAQISHSIPGASGTASADGGVSASPTIYASASAGLVTADAYAAQAGGAVTLSYSFEIIGPSGVVPTLITGAGGASGSAHGASAGGGAAYLDVNSAGGDSIIADFACSGGTAEGCVSGDAASFTTDGTYQLEANTYYNVYLSVGADARSAATGPYATGSASGAAWVDPFIEIAPGFADSSQYSLWVTPGVANAPAAPEPATWALMLLGVGAAGGMARRARPGAQLPTR